MRLVLSLLGCCGLLHGAFDAHAWESRRLLRTTTAPFNAVTVDGSIYQSSQAQLRDLRVMRQGSEVPYTLKTFSASWEERVRAWKHSNGLTGLLVVLAPLMGWIALRLLRQVKAAE